jgi:hypothetical protein
LHFLLNLAQRSPFAALQWQQPPSCAIAETMPVEDMAAAGTAIAGCDLMPPRDPLIVNPSLQAMIRLLRLHTDVGNSAENAPHTIADAEVARRLEQSLIEAMVGCLSGVKIREEKWAQQCHSTIMRRFRGLIEDNTDRALYLAEICSVIGVPARTLQL